MSEAVAAHAEHSPNLAHHFETPAQQFESGKLGMWLFLATEVLMFGGLFCAYTIYRGNHPEIFAYGHQFLDAKWGGINTIVLICSSLTMAWGVRCAQLGQRKMLILMLFLTLACAFGFMGIKYVEYSHKIHHGLMWGKNYQPDSHMLEGGHGEGAAHGAETHGAATSETAHGAVTPDAEHGAATSETAHGAADGTHEAADGSETAANSRGWGALTTEHSLITPSARAPAGLATAPAGEADAHAPAISPKNVHIFFGIYFAMTGLHGIHVLAGMVVITGLIFGAFAGRYGPDYFTPVDLVGLYWHIVDLIWIFLFPLLYLID